MLPPPKGLTEADFELIQAAVMETERGRWFLAEFARRCRAEDSKRLLSAIERLDARATERESDRVRARLEADRAAEVLRQVADIMADLRPLADAKVRRQAVASKMGSRAPDEQSGLERRFAALVHLDEMDVEQKLNLFG